MVLQDRTMNVLESNSRGSWGDNCEFQWEKLPRQAVGVSQGKLYPSYNSLLDIQSLR